MEEQIKPVLKRNTMLWRWLKIIIILLFAFFILNFDFFRTRAVYDWQQATQPFGPTSDQFTAQVFDPKLMPNDSLAIPSLEIEAPLVYIDRIDEGEFQAATHQGVVHYPQTALLGQVGNAFYFGHSSDVPWINNPYRNVFALLPEINLGDLIYATNDQGESFCYQVNDKFIVSPNDTRVLDQETDGKNLLTLQTSYPFGTALARYIVVAELVNSENLEDSSSN